jgi:hypothetical protein
MTSRTRSQGLNHKGHQVFVWAISPGNIAAGTVAEPGVIWLMLSGLAMLGLKLRGNIG